MRKNAKADFDARQVEIDEFTIFWNGYKNSYETLVKLHFEIKLKKFHWNSMAAVELKRSKNQIVRPTESCFFGRVIDE